MAECVSVCRGGDRYRHDLIPKVSVACHRYFCEVRSRAEAMGILSTGFEEDRERFADLPVVKGETLGAIKV
jgi:hypothetical protein